MSECKELLSWLNLEVAPKLMKERRAVKPPKEKSPPKDLDSSFAKRPTGLSHADPQPQAAASPSSEGDQHPSTGASPSGDTLNAPRPVQGRDQSAASSSQTPMTLDAREASPLDLCGEWDEVEREERLVRAELTRAVPGDPILGHIEKLPIYELIGLPFSTYTTKYGSVYHDDLHCRYLTAPETGVTRTSIWCSSCRREADKKKKIPKKGDTVFIDGWAAMAHTDPTCERASRCSTFACCTVCL